MDKTPLSLSKVIQNNAIDELLARVRSMPGRQERRAWRFAIVLDFAFVAVLAVLGTLSETGWSALAAFALIFGPGIWMWNMAEWQEMRTLEKLAACKDPRTLGGLLDWVNCSNRRVRNAIQATLLELLPRLTEEHSDLLDTGQRKALNALLYGKSGELAMAALSALEQVGDATALPYLTSIAAGKGVPRTLRDRHLEVQQRAQHAVERIRERIERQKCANVLLRASHVPSTPSEQLVRSAPGRSLVEDQELLRSAASADPVSDQKEEKL